MSIRENNNLLAERYGTTVAEYLGIRERHRAELRDHVESGKQLLAVSDFLKVLVQQLKSGSENSKVIPQLIGLAVKSGASREAAAAVLGNLDKVEKTWKGMAVPSTNQVSLGTEVVNIMRQLFAENEQVKQLFSEDRYLQISNKGADTQVSFLKLFILDPEAFARHTAELQKVAADALLSDPGFATYNAYEWTKQQSREVAKNNANILDTPATIANKRKIATAHTKRNGLLKYVLFGDAGTGKSRLSVEDNRERGKETISVNFHQFLAFEDLIGQLATTIDMGGNPDAAKFSAILTKFEGLDDATFWQRMENVFNRLDEEKKKSLGSSVEAMVSGYEASSKNDDLGEGLTTDRDAMRKEFLERVRALGDSSELGMTRSDLETRWVEGVILKAIREERAILFDEMDKAGPHAIEGLLSFLALEPGDTWSYQGGTIKIPEDFYCTATSNGVIGGGKLDSAKANDMNRFLADRSEQIHIRPLPVKDALMLAAVKLSDENGALLLNKMDQQYVIAVISYIIPQLQAAGLAMPVTNRVINTFCSRLVDYSRVDGKRSYGRVKDQTGQPTTVFDAVRLSVFEMKRLSLSQKDAQKVSDVLTQFSNLLTKNEIPSFFDDLLSKYSTAFGSEDTIEQKRAAVIESVWQQPLFQAMGLLESEVTPLLTPKPQMLDRSFLEKLPIEAMVTKAPSLAEKVMGMKNGCILLTGPNGVTMELFDPDNSTDSSQASSSMLVIEGDYSGQSVPMADQLGKTFLTQADAADASRAIKLHKNGEIIKDFADEDITPLLIDPMGRYFLYKKNGIFYSMQLDRSDSQEYQEKIIIATEETKLLDVSTNGDRILIERDGGIEILELIDINGKPINPTSYKVKTNWSTAQFLGNTLVVGSENNPASTSNKVIVIST